MPQPLPQNPGIELESLAHEGNPDSPVLPECEHRFILNICSLSKHYTFVIAFISAQHPSSQKPNFKSYEKEKTVEPCAPTEDAGKDDIIFSGEVEITSKEQFVSNIAQTIPRLEEINNYNKISDAVHQKIAEAMSLLTMDWNHSPLLIQYKNIKMTAYNIWAGVEVGESLPEGSLVASGVPGKGLGKRQNINATKKTNKKCCTFEMAKDSRDQGDEIINVEVDHIDNEPPHTEIPPHTQ
ncbi:hypothetical protein O181_008944 [Austropuccinia psidii MF-1]|uniref:Uncharacterized protein n=1 Tax=Austropuccinia psidii MF-1 TaxID=1389203 RepID=A0A9Q3BNE7_9BASI|nr:hypothetical protein [Austropuccinia psidii MF-1]